MVREVGAAVRVSAAGKVRTTRRSRVIRWEGGLQRGVMGTCRAVSLRRATPRPEPSRREGSGRRGHDVRFLVASAAGLQRLAIGSTSRRVAPVKSWRGRPIFWSGSAIISFHCAIQPTTRASAKIAVNIEVGMPSARCTMPE